MPFKTFFLMNADGSNIRSVVENSTNEFCIVPGRRMDRKILFQTTRSDSTAQDIYVVNINGSGEKVLINTDMEEQLPVWSPDGSKFAYQAGAPRSGNRYLRRQCRWYRRNAFDRWQRHLARCPCLVARWHADRVRIQSPSTPGNRHANALGTVRDLCDESRRVKYASPHILPTP